MAQKVESPPTPNFRVECSMCKTIGPNMMIGEILAYLDDYLYNDEAQNPRQCSCAKCLEKPEQMRSFLPDEGAEKRRNKILRQIFAVAKKLRSEMPNKGH